MSFSVKLNTDDGTIAIFQTVHQNMAVPATPAVTGGSFLVEYEKSALAQPTLLSRVSSLWFSGENIKVTPVARENVK